jgi:hypothetical protein
MARKLLPKCLLGLRDWNMALVGLFQRKMCSTNNLSLSKN